MYDSIKKISIYEYLSKEIIIMSKFARIILFIMMVGLLMQTVSCEMTDKDTEKSNNDQVDKEAQVTETFKIVETVTVAATSKPTATETASPTTTATASPTVTETFKIAEKERKQEIAKNIIDYLNSEGIYTLENIQANHQYFFGETDVIKGILPLGMINTTIGQFFLIDANWDVDTSIMHLYLGAVDRGKNRIAFDYNFSRNFNDESAHPPVLLIQEKSSLYTSMATQKGEMLESIATLEEWNFFVEGNRSKPISINLYTRFMVEEWGKQNWVKEFDSYIDLRIAMFNQLPKFGYAVGYEPSIKIGEEESKEYLKCMWTKENYKGMESLNEMCASDYGMISIYIRRP